MYVEGLTDRFSKIDRWIMYSSRDGLPRIICFQKDKKESNYAKKNGAHCVPKSRLGFPFQEKGGGEIIGKKRRQYGFEAWHLKKDIGAANLGVFA